MPMRCWTALPSSASTIGTITGRPGSLLSGRSEGASIPASTRCAVRRGGRSRFVQLAERNAMPTSKRRAAKPPPQLPDPAAYDALTDQEIARQIAANPDAAPELSEEWFAKATITEPVDVKAIRTKLSMSQSEFAAAFGLSR